MHQNWHFVSADKKEMTEKAPRQEVLWISSVVIECVVPSNDIVKEKREPTPTPSSTSSANRPLFSLSFDVLHVCPNTMFD